jgi:cytochrome c-type biogenesis protein CcmH/NrfG
MYARRWSIIQEKQDAVRGIEDITEGFRLQSPPVERRNVLLLIRAQLYAATERASQAADDYRTVLETDPKNRSALHGLAQITNSAPSQ